ncbi:hypothetical protein RT0607 [Rickettsia typhi str. Wilmington]|uniref:Uncharacterized protein n=1 Tax=Rickettsia typhi (strain ATCC VR-144 / Wilmington) TaxID=257363 RepID=Q68WC1_RICTY|nr:hypothetical protein RT0607 [Rickettsia typhi str. Wilmington]AFE55288.1 hypothetical protein RTB9991CWPP_02925 [Rickettsia typhi str. B9991CWPP]
MKYDSIKVLSLIAVTNLDKYPEVIIYLNIYKLSLLQNIILLMLKLSNKTNKSLFDILGIEKNCN